MPRPSCALLLLLSSCGSPSPEAKCNQLVSVQCQKLLQCGAGGPSTSQAACETMYRASLKCSSWMLEPGCSYDWGPFDRCLADYQAASCEMAAKGQLPASCSGAGAPPVCADGTIYCNEQSSTSSGNDCSETYSTCADGKTYAVACAGGSCSCQVNGTTTRALTITNCSTADTPEAVSGLCGWKIK